MKKKVLMSLICLLGLAVAGFLAWAQSVPQLINYQGRLTDSAGQPLADGSTVDLSFAFYGAESGDTAYLTVLQEDVLVNGGLYNVLIGSGSITPGTETTLAAVFQKHQQVWMGVKVDADPEMSPRSRISSVPYAMSVDGALLNQWLLTRMKTATAITSPGARTLLQTIAMITIPLFIPACRTSAIR